jgi:hypothetical protein
MLETVQDMLVMLAWRKLEGRSDDRARTAADTGAKGNGPARNLHLPVVLVKYLSSIRSVSRDIRLSSNINFLLYLV